MKRYIRSNDNQDKTIYTVKEIKEALRQHPQYSYYTDSDLDTLAKMFYQQQFVKSAISKLFGDVNNHAASYDSDDHSDSSDSDSYTVNDIKDWLLARKDKASTLTDEQLDDMASQCYEYAKDEEAASGEPYADVDEIDLGELLDAADGKLYDMWHNLNGWDVEE